MIDFCILGSGIAGSTIAKLLSKKYSVQVFDKAKGVGGRTSNKRLKPTCTIFLFFFERPPYIIPEIISSEEDKNFIKNQA